MKIVVLNGSPRRGGNTEIMINTFMENVKDHDVVKLNIENLPTRSIIELADLAYGMIYKGLVFKLKGLDLNYFMTPDKIINAGNVIKNHNGTEIYGGNTIRDFLAHYSVNEKKSNLTFENYWT